MTQSTRRRVLQSAGGALAIGLAGCLGAPVGASTDAESDTATHGSDEASHHADDGGHHEHSPTEHESGHGHAHDEGVTPPSEVATARMTTTDAGHHFEPHVTWVHPAGTVTFVNESGAHTATAYHSDNDKPLLMPAGAASFDSGLLTEGGAAFEHTFDTPGVYHFYCEPHEAMGMLGSVIVGEPDPHDQPALGEVPSSLPETAQEKLEHLNEKCNEALGHSH